MSGDFEFLNYILIIDISLEANKFMLNFAFLLCDFPGENSIFFVADEAISDANYTQVIIKMM